MTAPPDEATAGEVVHLHKQQPATTSDDTEVLEGDIVEDDEGETDEVPVLLAVIDDLLHNPYVELLADNVRYVAIGAGVALKRRDARNLDTYERMLEAAAGVGDHEVAQAWTDRIEQAKANRSNRRWNLLEAPAELLGCLPQAAAWAGGSIIGVGILMAIAEKDPAKVVAPIMFIARVVNFVATVGAILFVPTLVLFPLVTLMVLRGVGRRHEEESDANWLHTAGDPDLDLPIDETTIARALGALRIPQINAYLKEGYPLQYLTTARRDGRGTHAVLRLPAGVTAEQIAKRRDALASGLYRRAQEVWVSTGDEAGIMDLWVADKGALAEGAGPYPLLDKGTTDVFKGVPFGKSLRGDPLNAPIIGRNTICGGQPDQGKSTAGRTIMLGCALDPRAELRIWVPDNNFDFEAFKPRCSRFVAGSDPEHFEQICYDLEELVEEIQVRGNLLKKYEEEQVTRALADKNVGLHPIAGLLEEAHLAFGHAEFGQRITTAAENIVRLGRKRGIHLIVSTQATTGDSVPVGITINASNGIAFAVARWQENDAILGQGAYSAGHRATDLIPGTDKGNAVVKGFTGERSVVAQAYYVSPSRGRDQVTPIINRALAEIDRTGRPVPGSNTPRPDTKPRDLLEDLDEVLGSERVRLADLPALLRDLAPAWPRYRTLTGRQLKGLLDDREVRVTNTGNVLRLDPADLREKIAELSTADLDDE